MGAPTWPPSPHTFAAPRRSRGASLEWLTSWGAPTWPPSPHTFAAPRRRPWRCSGVVNVVRGPRHGPQTPKRSSRPGEAVALLDHPRSISPSRRRGMILVAANPYRGATRPRERVQALAAALAGVRCVVAAGRRHHRRGDQRAGGRRPAGRSPARHENV